MNKKTMSIVLIVLVALIVGFLLAKKGNRDNQKPQGNGISSQEDKSSSNQNIYKLVSVNNDKIRFSFEIPNSWLTEIRNAKGYESMNEDEMRDFISTNYDGDIKSNSELTSDYTDLPWSMIEKMTLKELRQIFENKKSKYNYNIGFPSASVSSRKPIDAIWYSDSNGNQIDFYITDSDTAQNAVKNYKNDEFYENNPNLIPSLTKDIVGGFESYILTPPSDLDESGNPVTTKGSPPGMICFVMNLKNDKALVILKQSIGDRDYEDNFRHLIKTMIFE